MKCPHCGNYIESTLFKALEPYDSSKTVITNVDYVLEVGNRIRAIIEEKKSNCKIIRGFQLITLRKIAKSLGVPLYVIYTKNGVELYEFPTDEKVKTSPFVSFQDREPILSGSISDLGSFLNEKYLQAPLKEKMKKRRW